MSLCEVVCFCWGCLPGWGVGCWLALGFVGALVPWWLVRRSLLLRDLDVTCLSYLSAIDMLFYYFPCQSGEKLDCHKDIPEV
jgi:hypothetical protein